MLASEWAKELPRFLDRGGGWVVGQALLLALWAVVFVATASFRPRAGCGRAWCRSWSGSGWRWRRCRGWVAGSRLPGPEPIGSTGDSGPYRVGEAPDLRGHPSRRDRICRSWAVVVGDRRRDALWGSASI